MTGNLGKFLLLTIVELFKRLRKRKPIEPKPEEKKTEEPKECVMSDSNKYNQLIEKYCVQNRIPIELMKGLIQQESGFKATAKSHCDARGLGQIMPGTAKGYGISNPNDLYDPETNIRIACKHLKSQWDRFALEKGLERWIFAISAYNMGAGYLIDAQKVAKKQGCRTDKWCFVSPFIKDAICNGKSPDWKQNVHYVNNVIYNMYEFILQDVAGMGCDVTEWLIKRQES